MKSKHAHLILLSLSVVGFLIAAYLLGLGPLLQTAILKLRDLGPGVFFAAMAILPAFGFPLLPFTVAAGPVFGPVMGANWVVIWSITALLINLSLSYGLAMLLRPLAMRLVSYFGYQIPDFKAATSWKLVLLVRLAPGPPYWIQCYILGILRVAFIPYLVMSAAVVSCYIMGLVYGGDAVMQGKGKTAFIALAAIGAIGAAVYWYRKQKSPRVGSEGL
jgi:uncharacterized membrane protein YdjX (TVP38/TMEM64 family)